MTIISEQHRCGYVYALLFHTSTVVDGKVWMFFFLRYSHMCHMVGDRLVAVGGINLLPHTPGIGIVNLRTGQAQEFSFPVSAELCAASLQFHPSVMCCGAQKRQRHELAWKQWKRANIFICMLCMLAWIQWNCANISSCTLCTVVLLKCMQQKYFLLWNRAPQLY